MLDAELQKRAAGETGATDRELGLDRAAMVRCRDERIRAAGRCVEAGSLTATARALIRIARKIEAKRPRGAALVGEAEQLVQSAMATGVRFPRLRRVIDILAPKTDR